MTYRIFLSLNVFVTFVILLSTCNIKIRVLIVSFLNEFKYIVLRVIVFVLINISIILVMSSFLFLVSPTNSDFTLTFVNSSLTFYCLETSFSSVSLSSEFSSDSFSNEKDSFKILDSSLLKSSSSSLMVLSR